MVVVAENVPPTARGRCDHAFVPISSNFSLVCHYNVAIFPAPGATEIDVLTISFRFEFLNSFFLGGGLRPGTPSYKLRLKKVTVT